MNIRDISEINKLQNISQVSLYSSGIMSVAIDYCFSILQRHLQGDDILELGPAEGVMTEHLVTTGKSITVVEGSAFFCENLRRRFPTKVEIVNALFEEFVTEKLYDIIIMGHVLEHVQNPSQIISRTRRWLKPDGRIFASVPNAQSIHRQAAVYMGLLEHEESLNELDLHHGHRRVFNPQSFCEIFFQAGFKIDLFGGYWLKPLSNRQIEASWSPAMIEAFMHLGEKYPHIAGEIYILASTV